MNPYITIIGGNMPIYAVVIWTHKETGTQSKTVCYDEQEVTAALEMYTWHPLYRERTANVYYATDVVTEAYLRGG